MSEDLRRAERPSASAPPLSDEFTASALDPAARRDLSGLQKDLAESVARHLVAAGSLVDTDPEAALAHARYARRRASRIAVVREAAGIAAYHAGEWSEALAELRAARRMGGGPGHLAVMADVERAMGRPERAVELSRSAEARELDRNAQIELDIVVAGARRDLGELDAAVVALQIPELDPARHDPWSARLFYAHADNLLAAGRESDALQWFVHALDADPDRQTDADARVAELTGEPLVDEGIEFGFDETTADLDGDAAEDTDTADDGADSASIPRGTSGTGPAVDDADDADDADDVDDVDSAEGDVARDVGGTGSAHDVGDTGPAHEVGGTGSADDVRGTGPAHDLGETGAAQDVGDAGSPHGVGDTGAAQEVGDTDPASAAYADADAAMAHDVGSTGSAGDVRGTGPAQDLGETGADRKVGGTGAAHDADHTGAVHEVRDAATASTTTAGSTANSARAGGTADAPDVPHPGATPATDEGEVVAATVGAEPEDHPAVADSAEAAEGPVDVEGASEPVDHQARGRSPEDSRSDVEGEEAPTATRPDDLPGDVFGDDPGDLVEADARVDPTTATGADPAADR